MPVRSLPILTGCALALSATAALAQDFGTTEDQDYAAQLWQQMIDRDLAGDHAVQAFPYPGTEPHGMMLETFYTRATIGDHSGALVIKRNYGPEGVTADQVIGNREQHLGAVTIMFRRDEGYAPETKDWFWAKYLPDGSLDEAPNGTPLAGRAKGCISCHSTADGGDLLFTTDADLN